MHNAYKYMLCKLELQVSNTVVWNGVIGKNLLQEMVQIHLQDLKLVNLTEKMIEFSISADKHTTDIYDVHLCTRFIFIFRIPDKLPYSNFNDLVPSLVKAAMKFSAKLIW